ncbi:hypothetical protein TCAL_07224 [Tigriopus californicus]|uniref:Trehalase n=1 Tax=Tigriopus californicus TaxID=6832 RepID=A0A553NRD5_TIGCA|nr:hypothetical protein TCAL_07224 [Tigriopus californicus]
MPSAKSDMDNESGSVAKKAKMSQDVKSMSSKAFMDEFVVPVMLRALSAVNKERPDDPIDFLINYLKKEKAAPPPTSPTTTAGGPSEAKPESGPSTPAKEDTTPVLKLSHKVINGIVAERGQAPWQVLLENMNSGEICGGAIVNARFILTAAHCTVSFEKQGTRPLRYPANILAIVRQPTRCANRFLSSKYKYEIARVYNHPKYEAKANGQLLFDFALLQTARSMAPFDMDLKPICLPPIGPLLDAIQMSRIYPDSKTFVDKKLKHTPGKIIKHFEQLVADNNGEPLSKEVLTQFVDDNFEAEGQELEPWTPEDWTPRPKFVEKLENTELRGLAVRINGLWKDLSRRIKDEVRENPQLYSIIYVPNGFVVPGGRFREFYYWDTYWIVKALLLCEMAQTVRGIIENFLTMVETYGMVPNGGRIYYIKRSQPPFLTLMMKEYIKSTGDLDFLSQHVATLDKELQFWEKKRSVTLTKDDQEHLFFVFGTGGTGPRPESYREDFEHAETFTGKEEKEAFYYHIKAGAESGWDYSTRWMINAQAQNQGTLLDVKTSFIVPVDLNAIMYMNYKAMSDFYTQLGDTENAEFHTKKATLLKEAIGKVLWSEEDNMWFDYDLLNDKSRKYFYPSNLLPLWAECFDEANRATVTESSIAYLKSTGTIYCKGGVPTSLEESGQQWDFPNAWPPLQHILVAGLLNTKNEEARQMALNIARTYTQCTIFSCPEDAEVCHMFEKYDVNATGVAGGGGEYDVQTGFGWSNGVVFEFISLFGDDLMIEDPIFKDECQNFKQEIELNTHFDVSGGKSKLLRRDSNVNVQSVEQNPTNHPVLTIEETEEENPEKSAQNEPNSKPKQVNLTAVSKHDFSTPGLTRKLIRLYENLAK